MRRRRVDDVGCPVTRALDQHAVPGFPGAAGTLAKEVPSEQRAPAVIRYNTAQRPRAADTEEPQGGNRLR